VDTEESSWTLEPWPAAVATARCVPLAVPLPEPVVATQIPQPPSSQPKASAASPGHRGAPPSLRGPKIIFEVTSPSRTGPRVPEATGAAVAIPYADTACASPFGRPPAQLAADYAAVRAAAAVLQYRIAAGKLKPFT